MYQYKAQVIRVVDGDTVWLEVDLGFDVRRRDSFRLVGINAPEMRTAEGVAAREWLVAQLAGAEAPGRLTIATNKDKREKFGRYLATLWVDEFGPSVNDAMVTAGHAVVYP